MLPYNGGAFKLKFDVKIEVSAVPGMRVLPKKSFLNRRPSVPMKQPVKRPSLSNRQRVLRDYRIRKREERVTLHHVNTQDERCSITEITELVQVVGDSSNLNLTHALEDEDNVNDKAKSRCVNDVVGSQTASNLSDENDRPLRIIGENDMFEDLFEDSIGNVQMSQFNHFLNKYVA